jgi:glucan phosphoethanolaminetransferase (alkaline phosphatase superfamily)
MKNYYLQRLLPFLFPFTYIASDVAIRSQYLVGYKEWQWSFYGLSLLTFVVMYFFVVETIARLGNRPVWRNVLIGIFSIYLVVSVAGSFSFYYFNGFYPNYYTYEYFKNEPMSAFVLLKDTINARDLTLFTLVFGSLFYYFQVLQRNNRSGISNSGFGLLTVGGFGMVALMVVNVKEYDKCLLVDVNFAAAIQRHIWEYEADPTYKGKELHVRSPLSIPELDTEQKFNVLIVLCESLRRQNMSLYGYRRNTTPHLKRFYHRNRMNCFRFDHAFSVSSTTMLAVPAILHGIGPYQDSSFFYSQPLVWEYGKAAGYQTFFVSSHSMQWYHFDRFYKRGKPGYFWSKEQSRKPFFNDLGIDDQFTLQHLSRHLDGMKQKPFLGVVQLNATHYPYFVNEKQKKWRGRFVDEYDNSIAYEDYLLGKFLDQMKRRGLLKNTLIVFTSDHGESLKDHNKIGHVDSYYAETISVPLMVYVPEGMASGQQRKALASNTKSLAATIDIIPTILELMGWGKNPQMKNIRANLTGYSLSNPVPKDRMVITMNNNQIARFRVGISIIWKGFHYLRMVNVVPNKEEIYSLRKDPFEQHPMGVKAMGKWRSKLKEVIWNYEVCRKYFEESN